MSAKPVPDRDYFLTRIARALGCAGYPVEECDAILAWVEQARPPNATTGRAPCGACGGSGHAEPPTFDSSVISAAEAMDGLSERTAFLIQGICLACRGRGFHT